MVPNRAKHHKCFITISRLIFLKKMWVFVECTNILFNLVDYLFSASFHWVVFDKAALAKEFCLFWKHHCKNLISWNKEEAIDLCIMCTLAYSNYSRFSIQIYQKLSATPRVTLDANKKKKSYALKSLFNKKVNFNV